MADRGRRWSASHPGLRKHSWPKRIIFFKLARGQQDPANTRTAYTGHFGASSLPLLARERRGVGAFDGERAGTGERQCRVC